MFENYREMSADEKAQVRAIHKAIRGDRSISERARILAWAFVRGLKYRRCERATRTQTLGDGTVVRHNLPNARAITHLLGKHIPGFAEVHPKYWWATKESPSVRGSMTRRVRSRPRLRGRSSPTCDPRWQHEALRGCCHARASPGLARGSRVGEWVMDDFDKMTPALRAYLDYTPSEHEDGYEEAERLRKLIEPGLLHAYNRAQIDAYCVPENENPKCRTEHESPSQTYRLVVQSYGTKPGSWSYTQGRVYRVGSNEPIAIVNRNYHDFPFEFVENHPNGHAYLICGEDYQGSTVIELDTGRRRDYLPDEAAEGFGFCWAVYKFHPEAQLLVVDGCYWACPYEYRFYDFADPMAGWPELKSDEMILSDRREPVLDSDGTITTFQTARVEDDPLPPVAATRVFRRDGEKLVLVGEHVTPEEQERRAKNKKAQKAFTHARGLLATP
jgi:hypothetical protein